jgi:hypothetical protein
MLDGIRGFGEPQLREWRGRGRGPSCPFLCFCPYLGYNGADGRAARAWTDKRST